MQILREVFEWHVTRSKIKTLWGLSFRERSLSTTSILHPSPASAMRRSLSLRDLVYQVVKLRVSLWAVSNLLGGFISTKKVKGYHMDKY